MRSDAAVSSDPFANDKLELGQRIRSIRVAEGLTLEAVATSAGVSRSLISQVERGRSSPSISTLRRIATALRVPVAAFFPGEDEASNGATDRFGRHLIVRSHQRKSLRGPGGSGVSYALLTPDLNRNIEFLWVEYAPGSSTPLGPHPGEEVALCLEGSAVIHLDGEEFVINQGDCISFDCGLPHRVENRTDARAVLICAITPPSF